MSPNDQSRELFEHMHNAQTVEEILRLLVEADLLVNGQLQAHDEKAFEVLADAFRALRLLTEDDSTIAAPLITDLLVPLLSQDATNAGYAIVRLRTTLAEWLDSMSPHNRRVLRATILDLLTDTMRESLQPADRERIDSISWTISSIGLRRDTTVFVMWQAIHQLDDEYGDLVLAALTTLSLPPSEKQTVIAEANRRASVRRTRGLMVALRTLADPSSIQLIGDGWLNPHWEGVINEEMRQLDDSLCLGILATIADRADGLSSSQVSKSASDIWQQIIKSLNATSQQYSLELALRSDLAPICASSNVVPTLLHSLTAQPGNEDSDLHHRYIVHLRLAECIRPIQLEGWITARRSGNKTLLRLLRQDACRDTGTAGRWSTMSDNAKDMTWQTALRLGSKQIFSWIQKGIVKETNPFLRAGLYHIMTNFACDPLPKGTIDQIRAPLQVRGDITGEVAAHMAAVDFARSAATLPAFNALLQCGLRFDDHWLGDVQHALGDVAISLVRTGSKEIIPALIEQLFTANDDGTQTVAAFALGEIASRNLLPAQVAALFIPLLEQEDRSAYQRGLLLFAITNSLSPLPKDLISLLQNWAQSSVRMLYFAAIEALAHTNMLVDDVRLLTERLRLEARGNQWDLPEANEASRGAQIDWQSQRWFCGIVALLYRQSPEQFVLVLSSALSRPSFEGIEIILQTIEKQQKEAAGNALPEALQASLVARLRNGAFTIFHREEAFTSIVRLVPERIVQEPWADIVRDWPTEARMALTNALGKVFEVSLSAVIDVQHHLLHFCGDGQYGVRRAAYRALAAQTPAMLRFACFGWAATEAPEIRQHAAEACAWIEDIASDAETLYLALLTDPEPQVREAADRSWHERRRRHWANEELLLLEQTRHWNNDVVRDLWRHGSALVHLGDDQTYQRLRMLVQHQDLPLHVQTWLVQIIKDGERKWEEARKKWPAPWEDWNVDPIVNNGMLYAQNNFEVSFIVWKDALTPFRRQGLFWSQSSEIIGLATGNEYNLHYENTRLRIQIQQTALNRRGFIFDIL